MKRIPLYLLVFCLLATFITCFAPKANAVAHTHCVCADSANGIGDHSCTPDVTWEPWDGTGALLDGHSYYLNDTDGDGKIVLSSTLVIEKKTVSICLNGVELTCAGRTLQVNGKMEGGKTYPAGLNICDCTGKGSVTSTSQGIAPVLHSYTASRGDVTINLYGGSLVAMDKDSSVTAAAGVMRLGNNSKNSGSSVNYTGTFNMYGGHISGGMTTDDGGNLYISIDCYFNMYGGTITGGQTASNGGNVFVSGHMNMQGGKICGGSAGKLGGGVYLSETDTDKATITLGGTAQITDNTKSNLYLPEGKSMNLGALAKPARIGVTPVTTTNFASTANESDARYFFSDDGKYAVVYSSGVLKLGSHAHCVCGGSVAGHNCTNLTWTSLSAALAAKGMTADTADFGKLAKGNYFLDCDITVTGTTNLTKDISLCLNGYSISREEGKIFGYLKNGYTLNICDCSGSQVDGRWSWKGSVNGGTNTYGSVIYTHYGSTLNIYGGNFTGKGTSNGGVIVVANDGAPDLNQDGTVSGEEKNLATPSVLNLYNGSIYGSQTAAKNSTIASYHTALAYWYGGQLHAGKVEGAGEVAVILEGDRLLSGSYTTLKEALTKVHDGQYIRLIADVQEACTVSGAVHLDLNGHTLSDITVTGQLYAFDTVGGGVLSCTGRPVTQHTYHNVSYIALADDSGHWRFYQGFAQITKISLKPGSCGMGYKASYHVDESVAQAISSYGYQLWLDGYPIHTFTTKNYTPGKELTLRLQNVLSINNDMQTNFANSNRLVHARAYIMLNNGTTITSDTVSYNLRQMLELADTHYSNFSSAQKDALQTMYSNYESLLLGWDMPNIIHADGWTEVSQKQFEENLTKSGDDYLIAPGKYTLTEDFALGDKILRVAVDKEVTICLNGHTISGNDRLFKVYGTLNICDCHSDEQEGTLTSALAAESAESQIYAPIAYIYPGTMNIYGGKLIATEKVVSGGVIAVGSGTYHGVKKTPGVLNIMGGHFSGGQTFTSGGLIWVLDKATMNMYAGTLAGGVSDGNGGAIYGGGNTTLNLYGGTVVDSTSGNYGGGVYCANDAALLLGSRLTLSNNTAIRGGNVYNNSEKSLVIDGAVITGGSAENYGGGVYCAHGSITLKGDAVVRDNTQGNLYVPAQIPLDTAALTQDSQVYLYNMSAMTLNSSNYLKLERNDYKIVTFGGQTVVIPKSFTIPTDVEGFQVGYGRSDITPTETGLPLAGYGNAASRLSTTTAVNVYDELKVSCVAITDEQGQTVLLMSVDLIRPGADLMDTIFPAIIAATGVPESHIFTTFTHTHSVPETNQINNSKIQRYNAMLPDKFAESANMAMADRQPSTMQTGSFEVGEYGKQLNFTRHYQYEENGVVKYFGDNFGTATFNSSTKHVTEADHTMHLVKFTRDGKDILMANWRVHPHMTGGGDKTYVSADLIGATRYHFEKDTDCHFIYLQGAAGNVNETSKLDDEKHGYTYYKYGNDLANQIDKALTNHRLKPTPVGLWQVDNYNYTATSDIATDDEYAHAKAASAAFNAWLEENPNATSTQKKAKCEELGYMTWFHFNNVITRHGLDKTYQLPLNTFALGNSLAFFTAPGELWDTVSMEIEKVSPFAMTLCIGYSQDHFNYFVYDPDNGGQMTYESYESNNYRFVAPNTINDMIRYWVDTLQKLYAAEN